MLDNAGQVVGLELLQQLDVVLDGGVAALNAQPSELNSLEGPYKSNHLKADEYLGVIHIKLSCLTH